MGWREGKEENGEECRTEKREKGKEELKKMMRMRRERGGKADGQG